MAVIRIYHIAKHIAIPMYPFLQLLSYKALPVIIKIKAIIFSISNFVGHNEPARVLGLSQISKKRM